MKKASILKGKTFNIRKAIDLKKEKPIEGEKTTKSTAKKGKT